MLLHSRADVRYRQAIQYGEESLAIARRLGLREQLAFTLNDLSPLYPFVGESERALELGAEARAMWREMNNLPMLADNLNYAAMTHLGRGEIDQAVAISEEARRISQMTGNQWGEAFSLTWVGAGYLELGRPDQAIAAMEDALRLGEVFPPTLAITRATLAHLYADLGAREHALELARQALSHAEAKFPVFVPWAAGAFVHTCVVAGDLPQAEATLKRVPMNPDNVNPRFDVALQLAAVELALAKGEYEPAVSLCDTILARQRAIRLRQNLATALLLKGEGLRGLRQLDEAFAILSEARGEAEATHARWSLWQILAALSRVESQRGNADQAEAQRTLAREVVASIATHAPPDLRDSFLSASRARLS
ncbi:MAG: hypothetical protein A2Z03_09205 [Chloroflexi bacterium RBG_16_56_8]|nr:MAG: hypothetical protein A2Z03_09205 [Chloroflexi bacterium RBG_16_56_8]